MNRIILPILTLGLSLSLLCPGWAAAPNPEQARALAEIVRLGGKLTFDEKSPEKPVVGVDLSGPQTGSKVTDADLECLAGMTSIQSLDISLNKVSDGGLKCLTGLTNLESLNLMGTTVTDASLERLKGLTNLRSLDLRGTNATDMGMEHLRQFARLRSLYLGAKVTDAGLLHLKLSLIHI